MKLYIRVMATAILPLVCAASLADVVSIQVGMVTVTSFSLFFCVSFSPYSFVVTTQDFFIINIKTVCHLPSVLANQIGKLFRSTLF